MSGEGEYDVTTTEDKTTGGASGGGDDDPRDSRLPDAPTDTCDQRRRFWERTGARPKDPYAYEKVPMSEHSGLPPPKGGPKTAETSFIEGDPSGRVRTADSMLKELANQLIKEEHPPIW